MQASKQRRGSHYEDASSEGSEVQVDGLVKVFRKNPFKATAMDKKAVNGIVFGMRAGEVFSLLGHNGAGKTTTINMLCGLYDATAGDATVFGRSIRTDMPTIRSSIGFCPQHDVLYPELTVWEHLEFYGRIKGVSEEQLQGEVAFRIAQVGLGGKEHNNGAQLSGGMKRKLSLAIAYLGNSSFIVLDEPTAGLDPVSRRFVWDIIQANKKGKVTLLTTHFMDEADILGDRIGIVANGVMRCCGSSSFLKARYGIGYHLDIAFPSEVKSVNPAAHAQLIEEVVPGSKRDAGIGSEISFLLPLKGTPSFPQLLRQLEARKATLGHESVGLSLTTLEEVFLRIADDSDEFHGDGSRPDKEASADNVQVAVVALPSSASPVSDEESPSSDAAARGSARRRSSFSSALPASHSKNQTNASQPLLKDVDIEPAGGSRTDHFVAIFTRRLLQFSPARAPANLVFNMVIPILFVILAGIAGSSTSAAGVSYPFLQMSPSTALRASTSQGPAVTTIYSTASNIASAAPLVINQQPSQTALIDTLVSRIQNPQSDTNMDSAFSFDSTSGQYGVYINRQFRHALPVALNYLASNAGGSPPVAFTLYNAPLVFQINRAPPGVFAFLILVEFAFCLAPGAIISKAVIERASKARHLLRVMGTRTWVYWATNALFDLIWLLIFALVCIICAYAFKIQGISSNTQAVFSITVVWTAAVNVLFCYLLSFLFLDSTTAQLVLFGLTILLGIIGGVVFYILNVVSGRLTGDTANTLSQISTAVFAIAGLNPSFHIIAASLSSGTPPSTFKQTLTNTWAGQSLADTVAQTQAANSFIYLAVQTVVFSLMIFVIESPGLRVCVLGWRAGCWGVWAHVIDCDFYVVL